MGVAGFVFHNQRNALASKCAAVCKHKLRAHQQLNAALLGGLVRAKNFLSVLVQVGAIAAVASVLWIMVGYTLAFGPVSGGFLGGGFNLMLANLGNVREGLTLPESTFALFQMTFAVITPALMVGAWVDRARFGWVLGFCALWGLLVYAPVAHWVWGGGWLATTMGTLDFAGGIVVHTTAGVSALVVALLLGKRIQLIGSTLRNRDDQFKADLLRDLQAQIDLI